MISKLSHLNEHSVYPGEYVPISTTGESIELIMQERDELFPYANTTEYSHSYKIEVAIPGVNRDEFRIQAEDNLLLVCVIHKKSTPPIHNNMPDNISIYEYYERQLVLPEDADTSFVSATYQAGILCIHVPKTNQLVKNQHTDIIIY